MTENTPPFASAIVNHDTSNIYARDSQGNLIAGLPATTSDHDVYLNALFASSEVEGGAILFAPGTYRIKNGLEILNQRGDGKPISLVGMGSPLRGVHFRADSTTPSKDSLLNLGASERIRLENLFLDGAFGGSAAFNYVLRLSRQTADPNGTTYDPNAPSAGRHRFINCTATNAKRASLVSFGSEMLYARQCNFQRAPIGAVVSAYPLRTDVSDSKFTTEGLLPIDPSQEALSNGGTTFINCTFGNPGDETSRAAVLLAQAVKTRHIGCIYQTKKDAEARVIMDETWGAQFIAPWMDSPTDPDGMTATGAPTAFKVGLYNAYNYGENEDNHLNQFTLQGLSIDSRAAETGETLRILDGRRMKGCVLDNVWINRTGLKIKLRTSCHQTQVRNVFYGIDGITPLSLSDFEAVGTGTLVLQGHHLVTEKWKGMGSGSGAPTGWLSPSEWGIWEDTSAGTLTLYAKTSGGTRKTVQLM